MVLKFPLGPVLAGFALAAAPAHAALVVTGGDFGTEDFENVPSWSESTPESDGLWADRTWKGSNTITHPAAFGASLIFDGRSASQGWVYQSLGTVSSSDAATGNFTIIADFGEKSDGWANNAVFTVYSGTFTGGDGAANDIATASGLSTVASFTLTGTQQGLTIATGNNGRANNQTVGSFDVSGRQGQELWLRIAEQRIVDPSGNSTSTTGGDLIIDNVRLVPEPGSAILGGLGLLGLLRRRRR